VLLLLLLRSLHCVWLVSRKGAVLKFLQPLQRKCWVQILGIDLMMSQVCGCFGGFCEHQRGCNEVGYILLTEGYEVLAT
jgi:hypothetical protein